MKIDFLQLLHDRNTATLGAKNLNCAIIGESGSGKSWGALRIAETYYDIYLNKKFPVKNVVFTISEFLERVGAFGKEEKCSILIFDDAGLKYSSSRWYDELNQILGYTLQSYRYRIINVFFTIPVLKWLDRIGRGMLHSRIELKSIGNAAYYKMTYNQFKDKMYHKRTVLLNFSIPGQKLINEYENKKHEFLQNEYDTYLLQAKLRENEAVKDLTINKIIDIVKEDMQKYMIKGRVSKALVKANLGISEHKSQDVTTIINNNIL